VSNPKCRHTCCKETTVPPYKQRERERERKRARVFALPWRDDSQDPAHIDGAARWRMYIQVVVLYFASSGISNINHSSLAPGASQAKKNLSRIQQQEQW